MSSLCPKKSPKSVPKVSTSVQLRPGAVNFCSSCRRFGTSGTYKSYTTGPKKKRETGRLCPCEVCRKHRELHWPVVASLASNVLGRITASAASARRSRRTELCGYSFRGHTAEGSHNALPQDANGLHNKHITAHDRAWQLMTTSKTSKSEQVSTEAKNISTIQHMQEMVPTFDSFANPLDTSGYILQTEHLSSWNPECSWEFEAECDPCWSLPEQRKAVHVLWQWIGFDSVCASWNYTRIEVNTS